MVSVQELALQSCQICLYRPVKQFHRRFADLPGQFSGGESMFSSGRELTSIETENHRNVISGAGFGAKQLVPVSEIDRLLQIRECIIGRNALQNAHCAQGLDLDLYRACALGHFQCALAERPGAIWLSGKKALPCSFVQQVRDVDAFSRVSDSGHPFVSNLQRPGVVTGLPSSARRARIAPRGPIQFPKSQVD